MSDLNLKSWTVSNNCWMILGQNLIASVIPVPEFKDFREFLFQLLDVHLNCLYIPKRSFGYVVFSRLELKVEILSYFEVGKRSTVTLELELNSTQSMDR